MAIRISGMISGLDTDAIVKELVSAYSTKKDNMVKEQTKLEWKIDAWKELNTKINNFYSKSLSDMRFTKAFNQKTTSVSDPAKATVKADNTAVNGTQALKIGQLASSDSIVGGKFKALADGGKVTGSTTLADLGYNDTATIWVKNGTNGAMQHIDVTKDTTVNNFVSALKNAGLNANFDEGQQRLYVSAKNSGKENAFELVSDSASGFNALKAFGVLQQNQKYTLTQYRTASDVPQEQWEKELNQLREDADQVIALTPQITKLENTLKPLKDNIAVLEAGIQSNKDDIALKEAKIQELRDAGKSDTDTEITTLQDAIKACDENTTLLNNELTQYKADNNFDGLQADLAALQKQKETLLKNINYSYNGAGSRDGADILAAYDDSATRNEAIQSLQERVMAKSTDEVVRNQWEKELEQLTKDYEKADKLEKQIAKLEEDIKNDTLTLEEKANIQRELDSNQAQLKDIKKYLDYNGSADSGKAILEDYKDPAKKDDAILRLQQRIENRNNTIKNAYGSAASSGVFTTQSATGGWASRTEAQDAKISLDGVMYESSSNTFSVNGLTITAQSTTGSVQADGSISGDPLSITTSTDVDGIYNMIKGFLKEYNALITEMDKLYNAKSAKGYMPLTDDEKDKMSETEVEKWEKKIKDSLLRRDATLGSVSSTMKSAMTKSYDVEGKTYSLASFGIKTLSYFLSGDNEKGVYHIDGDSEDSNTKGEKDKLRAAIATDPDVVSNFFTQFAKGVYTALDEKMTSIKNVRSRYSVYNDKTMQKEYDDYTSRIKEWEKRIKTYEDSYYDKFSKMESALGKLQNQTSSLTSMLGLGG